MKQMLKIELERAFKSAGLKVSLLIGIVISTLHFFQKVLPTALDPLHFYKTGNLETVANVNNMWMAMGEGWHYTLYVRLIPLLAVVPYAVTYYTDYKAPISGVALFKYDKNFNISVDQLDDIDSKMLDSIENNFISIDKKDHKVSQDDVVLRLIDLNQVYICIFQEKNKEIFKEGQDVKVVVNDSKIDAKVEKIYDKKSEDVVAIKIMEQNAIIYNTRVQEFGIIYRKIQGFKIPIESVVEKNKKLGVYVIDEENKMPKFVNIGEDYYKDAKYYYVDYNKNKESLNLYDRILLYPNFINKNIKVSR